MKELIHRYIEDRKLAWSPTTLRSELYRLREVQEILDGNPQRLWDHLASRQKPYSRVTSWTRVTAFWDWMVREGLMTGSNPYHAFRQKNARLFKHVYQTKTPAVSFDEAAKRLNLLTGRARGLGLQMLGTGERFFESQQETDDRGRVVGKGSKPRHTYRPEAPGEAGSISYASFRRALQAVGLAPHDLRKLFATRMAELGATEVDLLKAMGWSSMETAKRYLQPKKDDVLKQMFKEVQHATKQVS